MNSSRKRYGLVASLLLLFWLLANSLLRFNLGLPVRLVNDDADWWVYFLRGVWMPAHLQPYRDVFSEYPQVPTLLFGLLRMPFLGKPLLTQYVEYAMVFSGLMLACLFCLFVMVEKFLPEGRKHLAFFLLLPAPLYFSYNRFDILPALLCFMAIVLVRERMWPLAAALLGVATLTKWYPAILVPLVLIYMSRMRMHIASILLCLATYGAVCTVIVLPTLLSGGLPAILVPYQFHAGRIADVTSLQGLLQSDASSIALLRSNARILDSVFLVLQFALLPAGFIVKIDSFRTFLIWSALTITSYVLFARIWSPQWLLWIFPLLLPLARRSFDIGLVCVYGVFTYLEFPLIFDLFGEYSPQMRNVAWLHVALLVLMLLSLGISYWRVMRHQQGPNRQASSALRQEAE